MNRKGERRLVTWTVLISIFAGSVGFEAAVLTLPNANVAAHESGVDMRIKPGDDFYVYANEKWLKDTQIPAGTAEQARVSRGVSSAGRYFLPPSSPGSRWLSFSMARRNRCDAGYLADFIHGFGHFVGLDVHDAGDSEKPIPIGAVYG